MKADTYYGKRAANYDAERCHSLRWANEQRAVADMVFSGPVLDVPLGTGRYVGIYEEKGLKAVGLDISPDMIKEAKKRYPDLETTVGSIFSLPFPDQSFDGVVCIRLLDWLYPNEMALAVAELRRVARVVIVSIRYGPEEERVNYTHSLASFFAACQGLFICDRRVTEITRDGTEEIFRLRRPEWSDVVRQFRFHGHTPEHEMDRLACEWLGHINLREGATTVAAEYWSGEELGAVIDEMAAEHDWKAEPVDHYRTNQKPKYLNAPATILKARGRTLVLDGRRRINQWRKEAGLYPVLVVTECRP